MKLSAVSVPAGSVVCLRIALGILIAFLVGWERSIKRHSAGLRTFMIVTLSADTAMMLDLFLADSGFSSIPVLSAVTVIGTAMLSGNAVLFSSRNQIKGVTTSAALLGCAFIGLSIGAGLYVLTGVLSLAVLCCLSLFPAFERYLKNRSNHFEIHLELKSKAHLQDFIHTIRNLGVSIDDIEANPAYLSSGLSVYTVSLTVTKKAADSIHSHQEIIDGLATLDYISHVEEII